MKLGVAHRLEFILDSYKAIVLNIPVKRTEPLSSEEVTAAGANLNSIYLHLQRRSANIESPEKIDLSAFEKLEQRMNKIDSIGTFRPVCFINNFKSDIPTPLYPTLPDDVKNLLTITKGILEFLKAKIKSTGSYQIAL